MSILGIVGTSDSPLLARHSPWRRSSHRGTFWSLVLVNKFKTWYSYDSGSGQMPRVSQCAWTQRTAVWSESKWVRQNGRERPSTCSHKQFLALCLQRHPTLYWISSGMAHQTVAIAKACIHARLNAPCSSWLLVPCLCVVSMIIGGTDACPREHRVHYSLLSHNQKQD